MAVGLLIAILVILIIIVVKLIVSPEEKIEALPPVSSQSLEEEIAEAEIQKVVRRMAEELPEKYRLVVYLYYSREQKIEEIASMLHIPKGTVKSRLHKARSMIRDRMEAEGYEIS